MAEDKAYEEYVTIDDVLNGDGNVFAVIGRSANALKKSGCTSEYVSHFKSSSLKFHSYDDVVAYCIIKLTEAGFRWDLTVDEEEEAKQILAMVESGEYDNMTVAELKKLIK